MITHKEAEVLTSARQDAPLDPLVERELQAHLATCDECRAFAAATERLTAGIKALPSVPVNPRMRREVMEQVRRGRNPLAGLFAGFGGGFQAGPVLAAAATILIIGLFGWLALDRLVFDDGSSDDGNQIAAVPTEAPVEQFVASPTQAPDTEEPTTVPTEESTEVPTEEPTAVPTDEPTAAPTEVPTEEPTAVPTDEPTAVPTDEPTAVPTEVPTEEPTVAPTEESADDDVPVDLTSSTDETSEAVAIETEEPTEEPTTEPTEEPTVEPEPTEEPEPTQTPAVEPTEESTVEPEPTEESEPTQTPAIEPIDGTETEVTDGTGAADATEVLDGVGSGPEETVPPIEPTDTGEDDVATQEPIDEEDEVTTAIEPIDGAPEDDDLIESEPEEIESTPDEDETEEPDSPAGNSLVDVSVRYTGIDGDPSGHLGLTRDGRLEFMQVPDGASMTTPGGFRMQTADEQPGVVLLCGDGYCESSMEAPESESWQGDVPLGVIGESVYFLRLHSDRTEVHSASSQGTQLLDNQMLTEFGPTSAPSAVYENDGIMFAWLPSGQWLEISGGNAQLFSGGYSDPYNLRFAPIASQGPLLGYFSNGTLVIAPVTAPDSAILTLPTDGVDFDIAPLGDRVAVIRGSDIVIYDIQGNIVSVYEGGEMQPGSLIWLRGGIVYVDRATGALYEIPETAP